MDPEYWQTVGQYEEEFGDPVRPLDSPEAMEGYSSDPTGTDVEQEQWKWD